MYKYKLHVTTRQVLAASAQPHSSQLYTCMNKFVQIACINTWLCAIHAFPWCITFFVQNFFNDFHVSRFPIFSKAYERTILYEYVAYTMQYSVGLRYIYNIPFPYSCSLLEIVTLVFSINVVISFWEISSVDKNIWC